MEMTKETKRYEMWKASTTTTMNVESDITISEQKPEAKQILYYKMDPCVEEQKTGMNKVWIKGKLLYQVIYSVENEEKYARMHGEIPFMEEILINGVENSDQVFCQARMEQAKITMINSKKWSLQAKVLLQPRVYEEQIQEFTVDMQPKDAEDKNHNIVIKKEEIHYLDQKVVKKDLLRIHEEIILPQNYGNIENILWSSIQITSLDFSTENGKISALGKAKFYFLLETEETRQINDYNTEIALNEAVLCQESEEQMISDISYRVCNEDYTIKEDENGFSRIIYCDFVLELEMQLWKIRDISMTSDLYGKNCETKLTTKDVSFLLLQGIHPFHQVFTKKIELEEEVDKIVDIQTNVQMDECVPKKDLMEVNGNIIHELCLQTSQYPSYFSSEVIQPVKLQEQVQDLDAGMFVKCIIKEKNVKYRILNRKEIELVTELLGCFLVIRPQNFHSIEEVNILPLDPVKYDALAGITVYVVQKKDTLWDIGKEYYLSEQDIMEMNQLTNKELQPGDKLILMKNAL